MKILLRDVFENSRKYVKMSVILKIESRRDHNDLENLLEYFAKIKRKNRKKLWDSFVKLAYFFIFED